MESFNRELESLLNFQDTKDSHLIKVLFTYEVRNYYKDGKESSTFNFVFPWADGNLWHYWKIHDAESDRVKLCIWMAWQCYFLTSAVLEVHKERKKNFDDHPDIKES